MRLEYVKNVLDNNGYHIDDKSGWTVDASRGNIKIYATCPYDNIGNVQLITIYIDDTRAISSVSSYYTDIPKMFKYNNFELNEIIALIENSRNSGDLLKYAGEWTTEKILNVLP